MGLLLCAKKAKNPYVLPDKRIYSIEELCYYIYNNPYMINITFFTRELIDFIENELSMVSLAQKLKRGVDYGENIVDLVMHIFDASNYYGADEKNEFRKNLDIISKKTPSERVKSRADLLLESRKFSSAISAYSIILEKKDISKEPEYYGDVCNNIGIAYVNLFEYEEAIDYFRKAYEYIKKEDYLDNIVCAAILNDNEEIIEKVKKDYAIDDDILDKYRKVIEYQTRQIMKSKEYRTVVEKVSFEGNKTMENYKKQVTELLTDIRAEYRREIL